MPCYTTREGERLTDIVERECPAGVTIEEILADPLNAVLFETRSPNVLGTGDPLWLPESSAGRHGWSLLTTGAAHMCVVTPRVHTVSVRLFQPDASPIGDARYVLVAEGEVIRGTTDHDGKLTVELSSAVEQLILSIGDTRVTLLVGALEPAHWPRGVQARLLNLGYAPGPVDGDFASRSRSALMAFQYDHGLPATGRLNLTTAQALQDAYRVSGGDALSLAWAEFEIEADREVATDRTEGVALDDLYHQLVFARAEYDAMKGVLAASPAHVEDLRQRYEAAQSRWDEAIARGARFARPIVGGCCDEAPGDVYAAFDGEPYAISGDGDPVTFQTWVEVPASTPRVRQRFAPVTVAVDHYTLPAPTIRAWRIGKKSKSGYSRFTVSSRIAPMVEAAVDEVHALGGIVTSSGALRDLNAEVEEGRSATSLHYSGLAIDLYTFTATLDPDTDQYVIVREGWKFRIYCRTTLTDHFPERALKVVRFDRRTRRMQDDYPTTGHFFDLTAVFESHGFDRIRARSAFRKDPTMGNRLSMEWWHYQHTRHLTAGTTTFGDVLEELHPSRRLERSPPWQHRRRVFDGAGFSK